MSKIIKIPVLPHTHQMMLNLFGSEGIIGFDQDSFIGTLIYVGLEKIDFNLKPRTIPQGSIELKFKLPARWTDMDMSEKTAINVGRFLNEFFRHSMAMFGSGAALAIKNKQATINAFLEFAGVKELIELDTAKKMAQRRIASYQNRRRKNKRKDLIRNLQTVASTN